MLCSIILLSMRVKIQINVSHWAINDVNYSVQKLTILENGYFARKDELRMPTYIGRTIVLLRVLSS